MLVVPDWRGFRGLSGAEEGFVREFFESRDEEVVHDGVGLDEFAEFTEDGVEVVRIVVCISDNLCEPFLLDAGVCGHPVSEAS